MKKIDGPQTIGIIGGKGIIGSFFARVFRRHGYRIIVSDLNTALTNEEVIARSDVLCFAVPLHLTVDIIQNLMPLVRRDQLLIDFASLKIDSMRAMMKSKASVLGVHPMFRPSKRGLKNERVVICKGRADTNHIAWIENILKKEGAHVVAMSAKKHDQLMSIIQVLLHFHTIVLGNTFRKLKIPIRDTLQISSPIYKLEMDVMARIFSQDPKLYGAIEMLNPETKKVTDAFLRETAGLAKAVQQKDLKKFAAEFTKTSKFLGSFKAEAMREIDHLLKYLS